MCCRLYANTTALCPRCYDISGIAIVKKAIFSYAWKHISMSNAAEPFHDYSVILAKTCCVSFCLKSVAIKTLSIFCCFCTLVNLAWNIWCGSFFCWFPVQEICKCRGNSSAVYVNITTRICQLCLWRRMTDLYTNFLLL